MSTNGLTIDVGGGIMIRTHKVVISLIPTCILRMTSTAGVPDARSAEEIHCSGWSWPESERIGGPYQ